MAKPHTTRTYGPIHFEDLDPQRFEDLVRELVYDFRYWQSIEATGKAGSDGGMDIRAYERMAKVDLQEEVDGEEITISPMNGDRWQIQCKRYAEMRPQMIKEIVEHDLETDDMPYGYILVAPCIFSKKAYDTFRSVLAQKGVMEFYLWGKPELETMLYQPKNDRILFAFFGISLATKRRTRTAEIKVSVTNKNKLYRILGSDQVAQGKMFVRDVNDNHYPFRNKYPDFKDFPRWGEYEATQYVVQGILVLVHEYFAYWDERAKTWDYTDAFDFVQQDDKLNDEVDNPNYYPQPDKKVSEFWEGLAYKHQAKLKVVGLLRFEDMLLIDEKGDILYGIPHIFMDFKQGTGPFARLFHIIEQNNRGTQVTDDSYQRMSIFPETFPEVREGKVHRDKKMTLNAHTLRLLSYGHDDARKIYYAGDTYDFLAKGDTIAIDNPLKDMHQNGIKITFIEKKTAGEILDLPEDREYMSRELALHIGRNPDPGETITVLEFKRVFMSVYEDGA